MGLRHRHEPPQANDVCAGPTDHGLQTCNALTIFMLTGGSLTQFQVLIARCLLNTQPERLLKQLRAVGMSSASPRAVWRPVLGLACPPSASRKRPASPASVPCLRHRRMHRSDFKDQPQPSDLLPNLIWESSGRANTVATCCMLRKHMQAGQPGGKQKSLSRKKAAPRSLCGCGPARRSVLALRCLPLASQLTIVLPPRATSLLPCRSRAPLRQGGRPSCQLKIYLPHQTTLQREVMPTSRLKFSSSAGVGGTSQVASPVQLAASAALRCPRARPVF